MKVLMTNAIRGKTIKTKPLRSLAMLFGIASILPLASCGVWECIDAQIPRQAIPLKGTHTVELHYKNRRPVTISVACEKYYDAMCAERGNYWGIREIGSTESPFTMKFMTIQDPVIGKIQFPRPSCELFRKAAPKSFNKMVIINGDFYFYLSTSSNGHVFEKRDYALQKIDPAKAQVVTLKFTIKVDGTTLLPPKPING